MGIFSPAEYKVQFSFMRLWLERKPSPSETCLSLLPGNLEQPDQILRLLPPQRFCPDEATEVRIA